MRTREELQLVGKEPVLTVVGVFLSPCLAAHRPLPQKGCHDLGMETRSKEREGRDEGWASQGRLKMEVYERVGGKRLEEGEIG